MEAMLQAQSHSLKERMPNQMQLLSWLRLRGQAKDGHSMNGIDVS